MPDLKIRTQSAVLAVWMCALLFLQGCATSSYRVTKTQGLKVEISVTPDRVVATCEKLSDENDLRTFIIHVLDEENSVLVAMQGNFSDEESCEWRKSRTRGVLDTGKNIYLAGMGNPLKPRKASQERMTFPSLGAFPYNGRTLQLMIIANENGACYGAYIHEGQPCPGGEFPIAPIPD